MASATAYLKRTCPFSLKFRIFISEAGLENRFDIVVFEDNDEMHRRLRQRLGQAGHKPAFPAVETIDGQFRLGSDELIAHYAQEAGIDSEQLPLLNYYVRGVFQEMLAREN